MKVIYFASIRQQIGKSEEIVIIEENCSIRDLIDKLVKKGENYKIAFSDLSNIKCSANCNYVDLKTTISNSDEVAFFPPVTGG